MLLYTVQFLCSVAAAFARLLRALRKAMASAVLLRSPTLSAVPAAASPAPLSLRRGNNKVHPIQLFNGDALHEQRESKEQLLVKPPVVVAMDVFEACNNGNDSLKMEVEKTKKAAWAARRRPSMLVIPVSAPPEACEMAAAVTEKEAEAEVEGEGEGEGFWVASRRGARHGMEDSYGVITHQDGADSQLAFYGVYDGHGGRAAVDLVSDRLGKNVVSAVLQLAAAADTEAPTHDAVAAAIRAAYVATDSEFLRQGVRGGSCAATALVKGGDLYVANLGDCRAVMSLDGAATALTSDHTAARDDERARIENSGGYVSCGSNGVWRVQGCLAVTRAFGDAGLKQWVISDPEIRRQPLTPGCEFLVLASDGLWNKVSNQEAVDAVSRSRSSRSICSDSSGCCCKELVELARGRGSRDDITVMVVDLARFLR